jgi:prophage antirepressor-like protein
MAEAILDNETLADIFGPSWRRVRTITHEGRGMHMAFDICEVLGISNVTTAVRGIDGAYRVDLENRDKVYVPDWNPRRKVHILSIEGVFQLIINSRVDRCKEIKRYLACTYLPSVQNLRLRNVPEAPMTEGGQQNG